MQEQMSADVIVVGAGLAGYCCAIEAAHAGAEVLLLEKQSAVGGSTVLSGGSFAFAGTDLQRAAGIDDSAELLQRDMLEVGGHKNDPRLVAVYVQRQLETYAWLRRLGVTFGPIQVAAGQSVPRQHPANPRDVIRLLSEHAARMSSVRLLTAAPVERLLRGGDGRVTAVVVRTESGHQRLHARRAVVLTTGGFSRNEALLERFVPQQAKAIRVGGAGSTGDGLRMAWQLGADFRDMGYIKGTFGNHPAAGPEQHTAMLALYKGAIAVNREGQRFVDESLSYKLIGDACLQQPGAIGFQIFDANIMAAAVPGVPIYDFARRVREGLLIEAPSLVALAARIDVPAAALCAAVERYNRDLAGGGDRSFGRRGLAQGYGRPVPIERAPFYAYPSTSAIIATYCGLTVDAAMQVLDVYGEVMPGLFAAGEIAGGFHGVAFMTGTSLGKASICGRLAGANAARA